MSSLLSKEQMDQFIKDNNIRSAKDIQTALKKVFGDALQAMLDAEMNEHLGYAKYGDKSEPTTNRRNGHSTKTVRSNDGEIEISVPRDRDSSFEPVIVGKRQRDVTGIEEQIIALYARGLSTRDIGDHLRELYGIEISAAFVSDVTDKILPLAREWQSRPLAPVYAAVFLDAIHYKVRNEGSVVTKACYMAIGIDLDGQKDVLGMWVGASETAKFWLSVLNDIKSRGTLDILIACTDNLRGFSEAIEAVYPATDVQKCIVHQVRNSIKYVSYNDMKKVTSDLRAVYTSATEEAAILALDEFEQTWGKKYLLAVRSWRENWVELSTFFRYPPEIRKIIYTTNVIEGYHRQLRKVTKGKSIFPSDESLTKMLYLITQNVMKKWTKRIANWGQILHQLSILYPERVNPYID